jgi:hypothetical protein
VSRDEIGEVARGEHRALAAMEAVVEILSGAAQRGHPRRPRIASDGLLMPCDAAGTTRSGHPRQPPEVWGSRHWPWRPREWDRSILADVGAAPAADDAVYGVHVRGDGPGAKGADGAAERRAKA